MGVHAGMPGQLPYFKDIATILREQSLPLRHERSEQPERAALAPEPVLVTAFDHRHTNRAGLVVTVLLHVLVVLLAWYQPKKQPQKEPPPVAGGLTYVMPRLALAKPEPVPTPEPPKPTPKPKPTVKPTPRPAPPKAEQVEMARLPDTISVPPERVAAPAPPEPPAPPVVAKVEPQGDMSDMIAARRRARQRESGVEEQETAAQKGDRIARQNIASANRAGGGDDQNGTGGMFSWKVHTPFSGQLKFNGFNKNFRRTWLQDLAIDIGREPDIETAIIKTMVVLIRKEKDGDFIFRSERQQRDVTLSARVEDNEALESFLFKEAFPQHRRGR